MMIETTDPVLLPKSVVTNGYFINKNLLNSGINLFNHQSLATDQLKGNYENIFFTRYY
jgi:hypothetical protein